MPEQLKAVPVYDLARVDACLAEAAREVLETMFFLAIEGEAAWADVGAREHRHVAMEFDGPLAGRMDLAVSMDVAPMLASGFAGRDEAELTAGDVDGVLCEMANMLCGSLLSRLENEALFSLSTPRVSEGAGDAPGVCRVFDLGMGDMRVCISVHDGRRDGLPA